MPIIRTNMRGNYEVTYHGKIVCEGKTLEIVLKKASKFFKGQGI